MGVVRYTVINGEVVAEKRDGIRRQYVPNPHGSTVVLLDNTQVKTDTFTYWPYGEEIRHTGTTQTPFRYMGAMGYYKDSPGRLYVRARSFRTNVGKWLTSDPISFYGGSLNLYEYLHGNPPTYADPSGLFALGYGAVTLLGLIGLWLLKSCRSCIFTAKQLAEEYATPLGHAAEDGISNALLHCVGSCEARERCSTPCAALAGWLHELPPPFGLNFGRAFGEPVNGDLWYQRRCMDSANNSTGQDCAGAGCIACCEKRAKCGELEVLDIPPQDSPFPMPQNKRRCREAELPMPTLPPEGVYYV